MEEELVVVPGALTGATTTLDDEVALLDVDEVLTGATRVELEEIVDGGAVGGLIDPPGALPTFAHDPVVHFW